MKKITLMAAAMLASASMLCAAQVTEPTTLWANAFTNSGYAATSQGGNIALAPDGGVYAIAAHGTGKAGFTGDSIQWGTNKVAPGTPTTANSDNQSFMLSKIDGEGNLVWRVYTENGDITGNDSRVATTDDGVVAFFEVRHAKDYADQDVVFVDGKDKRYPMNWTLESAGANRYFTGILMKVSQDGEIKWIVPLKMNHDPQPNASSTYSTNTGQGIYTYALATDENGCIYAAGNMRTTMTIAKADGSDVVINPHNVEGWNGDPQKSVGNLYILKFDKGGNYVSHVVTGGEATHEVITNMVVKDNMLYFFGRVTGNGNAVTLGDKTITPDNTNCGFVAGSMFVNLKDMRWFQYYSNTKSGGTAQTNGMRVFGNNLWIMCKTNMQGIVAGDKTLTAPDTRDAMLIKVDATTGEALDGYVKETNQAGYFDCFEGSDGFVYVSGHTLLGPLTLEKFDPSDLSEAVESWQLISSTNDTQAIEMDEDGVLYVMARTRGNTTFINSNFTTNAGGFSCTIAAFQMPVKKNTTAITSVEGEKTVQAVRYYNLAGLESATPFQGVNIMVKQYTDGSRQAVKIIK